MRKYKNFWQFSHWNDRKNAWSLPIFRYSVKFCTFWLLSDTNHFFLYLYILLCYKQLLCYYNKVVIFRQYSYLKEVDLGYETQLLLIIGTFVFTILQQSHVSIKVTWTDFILFQKESLKGWKRWNLLWYKHITYLKSYVPYPRSTFLTYYRICMIRATTFIYI